MKVQRAKEWEDEATRGGEAETETESLGSGHKESVNDCWCCSALQECELVCQEARAGYQWDGGVPREKTERTKGEVVSQEANLGEAALRLGVSGHSVEYQQDI